MELIDSNCVRREICVLRNGTTSGVYYDVKNLVSHPKQLTEVADKMYSLLARHYPDCNLLCGVPIGGLPFCTYLSTQFDIPMIMARMTTKDYGLKKCIEGEHSKKCKCVIIEDVVTSGASINEVYNLLKDKVDVLGAITVLDRQENHKCKIEVCSVYYKNDITKLRLWNTIERKGRLCFAGDIEEPVRLLQILNQIGSKICICKVHVDIMNFSECSRADFIRMLLEAAIKYDFLIMEDRKFVDISSVVERQYKYLKDWADLVTVHGSVKDEVLSVLSGAMFVANMSNGGVERITEDYTSKARRLMQSHDKNLAGFITQYRINGLVCMMPGINISKKFDKEQNYQKPPDASKTDVIIVGRGIYEADNIMKAVESYTEKTPNPPSRNNYIMNFSKK